MVDAKETQSKPIASQDFLSEVHPSIRLPERFHFEEKIRYGLLAFRKWSEALATPRGTEQSNAKEVMVVIFLDGNNNIQVRDVSIGSEVLVRIKYTDITHLPHWQVGVVLSTPAPKEREFFLIPPDYNWPYLKITNKIVEKGKKILGFLHVHPTGQPPSPADLSHFLEAGEKELLQGVIAQDHFFLFVKTKETKAGSAEKEIEEKMNRYYQQTGNSWNSATKVLTEECFVHNIGFYVGDINQNVYTRFA